MKEKTYKFDTKGFQKMQLDIRLEKINKVIDIGFWAVIGVLIISGTISTNGIINIAACSATSKVVKLFVG